MFCSVHDQPHGAGLIGEEFFPSPNQNDQLATAQEIILDRPNNAES